MQLSYSWLNSLVRKSQEITVDENDIEISVALLLHFLGH